eukprot:10195818-Alexandrium_andersonii.AAC.1
MSAQGSASFVKKEEEEAASVGSGSGSGAASPAVGAELEDAPVSAPVDDVYVQLGESDDEGDGATGAAAAEVNAGPWDR